MIVNLSAEQIASLDETRKSFNRLTGKRVSLQQFFDQVFNEALESNAQTAALADQIMGRLDYVH